MVLINGGSKKNGNLILIINGYLRSNCMKKVIFIKYLIKKYLVSIIVYIGKIEKLINGGDGRLFGTREYGPFCTKKGQPRLCQF